MAGNDNGINVSKEKEEGWKGGKRKMKEVERGLGRRKILREDDVL